MGLYVGLGCRLLFRDALHSVRTQVQLVGGSRLWNNSFGSSEIREPRKKKEKKKEKRPERRRGTKLKSK